MISRDGAGRQGREDTVERTQETTHRTHSQRSGHRRPVRQAHGGPFATPRSMLAPSTCIKSTFNQGRWPPAVTVDANSLQPYTQIQYTHACEQVGYRPVPIAQAKLVKLLARIAASERRAKKHCKERSELDEVITWTNIATDECGAWCRCTVCVIVYVFDDVRV